MSLLERTIEVRWRHQVHFTEGVFSVENPTLREVLVNERPAPFNRVAKALVVVDEALAQASPQLVPDIEAYFRHSPDELLLAAPPLVLIGGETVKNAYFRVSEIHALIDRHHIDRHAYVIAIGGGALLDMVGLAAATAHRGVRLIRIPTTTLAQDDSGVGVKNGINAFGKKNFIGTFMPPFAVINDFSLLATLGPRDKRAGYVEAVKVACIRDREFFEWLEDNARPLARFEAPAMKRLIHRSAELHLNHIASGGDPFECGSARPLDFGHWAAHRLEQLSEYRIRHGEAVAIGIALDVTYARMMGYLAPSEACRIITLLDQLGFELFSKELMYDDETGQLLIINGIEEFREHLGGELTITLLREIGVGFEVHEMNLPTVIKAMKWLETRHLEHRQTLATGTTCGI
ncbi:MAG TPA: 3-dehydroquinate synthase [Candidatus Limnocylindria bacterium]|jgi:3-dehydroquinate synthase|nr:3-dehydroquinate synthase [Candidatus Limnocylindria bacterium]